jgi:hypothetical protein
MDRLVMLLTDTHVDPRRHPVPDAASRADQTSATPFTPRTAEADAPIIATAGTAPIARMRKKDRCSPADQDHPREDGQGPPRSGVGGSVPPAARGPPQERKSGQRPSLHRRRCTLTSSAAPTRARAPRTQERERC